MSLLRTRLTDLLGCHYPIVQAGMGGPARSELCAAVSAAGAYGCLGMVRESPELIRREIVAVRERTDRPFGVNLIPFGTDPGLLEDELAACFEARVHSLMFFWDVRPDLIARAHSAGCLVLYQVGRLEDAVAAEQAGADAVVCQGLEAGGHVHGTTTSLVLLPQVVAALSVPVLGSAALHPARASSRRWRSGRRECIAARHSSRPTSRSPMPAQAAHRGGTSEDTVHSDVFAINWPPRSPCAPCATASPKPTPAT
jgi:nitronate monooxygenase